MSLLGPRILLGIGLQTLLRMGKDVQKIGERENLFADLSGRRTSRVRLIHPGHADASAIVLDVEDTDFHGIVEKIAHLDLLFDVLKEHVFDSILEPDVENKGHFSSLE